MDADNMIYLLASLDKYLKIIFVNFFIIT